MLWGGRFSKSPDRDILEYNSAENTRLDLRLVPYDIAGSIAHVMMLEKQGILRKKESSEITRALKGLFNKWKTSGLGLDPEIEDVHTYIERAVSRKTEHGKKMHTARSRNDQVLADMRMYMRDMVLELNKKLFSLQKSFECLSKKDGPMAGYTHTRVAQPLTVSFWCDSYVQGLKRDAQRLEDCYRRINSNPLGACALAGTPWGIDRRHTARLLGFSNVQENELDAISSRGEAEAELLSALGITMARLSGLAEELIWLSQKNLLEIPEEYCTGSSIMPNKKNPDALELVRGRTSRVHSCLFHALSVKKGLIPGYHSDLQETKPAVMSGTETTLASISVMTKMVKKLKFNKKNIENELEQGFARATEIADTLAMQGMPFREAHRKAGMIVRECEEKGIVLSQHPGAKEMASPERKRLKRTVKAEKNGYLSSEEKRITEVYSKLLR
ncbi:argininosuccinate lyase [Candidatus Micrarchaeota archaeon]|nr:argininosuccinate lyase [Candidatus Micrarchaeota archaeon]